MATVQMSPISNRAYGDKNPGAGAEICRHGLATEIADRSSRVVTKDRPAKPTTADPEQQPKSGRSFLTIKPGYARLRSVPLQ
ncbi:hypothetical protein [Pseudomonas sp. LB3P58]